MDLYAIFLLMCMVAMGSAQDVTTFGAVGDGKTDDSKAFAKAWYTVCKTESGYPTLVIPAGKTFLLNPIAFEGPCNAATIKFQLDGNLVAPTNFGAFDVLKRENWIMFSNVNGLRVEGNGKINGKGSSWWAACPAVTPQCRRPTIMSFYGCHNLVVNGLHTINSARNHISIDGCNGAVFSNLHLKAPKTSTNTDGIDISASTNVRIENSSIGTGDDCIAVGTGIFGLNITKVHCGPGHGISVGSLGKNGEFAKVEGVFVSHCTLAGTQNGIRIKTFQGGSGYVRNIRFTDITFINSDNPIIIDQFYCPHSICAAQSKDVQISDVYYSGIRGTSVSKTPINLHCSKTVGCHNINLQNINIRPSKYIGTIAGSAPMLTANCTNAHGKASLTYPPVTCLLR